MQIATQSERNLPKHADPEARHSTKNLPSPTGNSALYMKYDEHLVPKQSPQVSQSKIDLPIAGTIISEIYSVLSRAMNLVGLLERISKEVTCPFVLLLVYDGIYSSQRMRLNGLPRTIRPREDSHFAAR